MAQFLLLAAIGLVLVAPICAFILGDAKRRHDAAQAYAAGYRAGQLAEFELQAQQHLQRQSTAILRQQAEDAARAYRAQREALG